jgi:hypothetical protein
MATKGQKRLIAALPCRNRQRTPLTPADTCIYIYRGGHGGKQSWTKPRDDARAQPLRLTPQGKRLIEKAIPAWEEAQRQATELLGDEGIALLNKAAKKLRETKTEG